jgi:ribosomal protein S18 acetylase RimI-like enzyme
MNMQVIVRLASEPDAELIADISRQTFYESFAAQNTKENMDKFMNEQFAKDKLIREIGEPGNTFLLAYYGSTVAGYLKLQERDNPENLGPVAAIELVRIYAVKSMMGKGIGKLLMSTSINIARERNKQVIWLGVWEHNQRAIEFYRHWGFEKFGEHDFILGNDIQTDWLMKKNL